MKKIVIAFLLCIIGINLSLSAQQDNRRNDFEKFKAEREAYITKEMGLTEAESAVFWPLNNELQRKKFELNKSIREQMRHFHDSRRKGVKVKDADYRRILELSARIKVKEAHLEEEYMKKYLEALPAEKVFKYEGAEHEFARKTMDNRGGPRDRN